MNSNNKLINTKREINLFFLKLIYDESFFWCLIHMGHTLEQSEIEYMMYMKN